MWLFRPRLCLGFGKPASDGIVPLLDKPLLRISDKAAALRLRDGVQLSDGTLHNLPCLPVTDNRCFLASNFPHFHRYDSLKSALYIHAVSKNINTFPKNQGRIRAAIAVEILDFTVMYR